MNVLNVLGPNLALWRNIKITLESAEFQLIYSDLATLMGDLPASLEALKNEIASIDVTYTRKSLVKGERFIRGMSK